MKVEIKRDLCIGAANCVAVAPEVYEIDVENKAILKKDWEKTARDTQIEAAKSCPTQAIFLFEDDGTQIFP